MARLRRDPLGKVQHTQRGFQLIEFVDHDGAKCSLQQSSLALKAQPGAGAVWLGLDGYRMQLDRYWVAALMRVLTRWMETGSFEASEDD